MKSFSLKPYEFEVDGETYTLPLFSIDTFEKVADLYALEPLEQVKQFRELLIGEADERSAAVIRRFPLGAIGELFRDWSGIGGDSGEASSSID